MPGTGNLASYLRDSVDIDLRGEHITTSLLSQHNS